MNILIFGDSITWGAYDLEKGGWAERLKLYYMEHDDEVTIYNLGISGSNTNQLLERLEAECRVRKPDDTPAIIVFATGVNDSSFQKSKQERFVPLEQFQANLGQMVRIAKTFTQKILFIGLTRVDESKTMPIPWHPDRFYDNQSIGQYDSAIKEFCVRYSLPYILVSDFVSSQDMEDGLHPDSYGHERMFQKILPVVQKILKK